MSSDLVYNSMHQVVICKPCRTCLVPHRSSVERHLRAEPHRLLGPTLKAHLAYTDTLTLRGLEALKRDKLRGAILPIEHLEVQAGFRCLLCTSEAPFYTIHLPRMRDHIPSHGRSAREHKSTLLWESCSLQSYFMSKSLINYFLIIQSSKSLGQESVDG